MVRLIFVFVILASLAQSGSNLYNPKSAESPRKPSASIVKIFEIFFLNPSVRLER